MQQQVLRSDRYFLKLISLHCETLHTYNTGIDTIFNVRQVYKITTSTKKGVKLV